jgi:putative transposase
MIDRNHELSISRQCELLGVPRSSVYYRPREVPMEDLALMRRLDERILSFRTPGAECCVIFGVSKDNRSAASACVA